jgi:hypothetical protein
MGILRADMRTVEHCQEGKNPGELWVSSVLLPAIRMRYRESFKLLELPEVVRCVPSAEGGAAGKVFFRHYAGKTYNKAWTETSGGSLLGLELSSEMPQLLADLKKIDVDWVLGTAAQENIPNFSFDLDAWLKSFCGRKAWALSNGWSDRVLEKAGKEISTGFTVQDLVFSNGDFYPRNLVRTKSRIILVDWEWRPGNRVCYVDHLSNVAAFASVHMWKNPAWQAAFKVAASKILNIADKDFYKSVLIKSFDQAWHWSVTYERVVRERLIQGQLRQFEDALTRM